MVNSEETLTGKLHFLCSGSNQDFFVSSIFQVSNEKVPISSKLHVLEKVYVVHYQFFKIRCNFHWH